MDGQEKSIDIWKSFLAAEQSFKLKNLKIEQDWKRLEARLGIMEIRLDRAREVRVIRCLKYVFSVPLRKMTFF